MADETKSPEQIRKEQIEARANEVRSLVGKSFIRKDGRGPIVKVIGYAGIGTRPTGNSSESGHAIVVEGGDARWTPIAKYFLDEYQETTPSPSSETNSTPI